MTRSGGVLAQPRSQSPGKTQCSCLKRLDMLKPDDRATVELPRVLGCGTSKLFGSTPCEGLVLTNPRSVRQCRYLAVGIAEAGNTQLRHQAGEFELNSLPGLVSRARNPRLRSSTATVCPS